MTAHHSKSVSNFKRYINKRYQSNHLAMEVTKTNLEQIRVLWKVPDAKVGDFVMKNVGGRYSVVDPVKFWKVYREPYR